MRFIQKKEFIPYYEIALKMVGMLYLDGTVDKSIAQRFLRVYFKDLKEEENEQVEHAAKAKLENAEIIDPAIHSQYNQMISLLSSLQSSSKNADNKKSKDKKS